MRVWIGLLCLLVGTAIALYGIGDALLELVGFYESALTEPLEGPAGQEEQVSEAMIRGVKIGAIGVPFLLVGSYLFWGAMRARRRRRRRYARSAPGAGGW